jgi:hypothetical protein
MKIILSRNLIAPDNGVPIAKASKEGVDIPDMQVIQYEQIRAQYIAIRDGLVAAYNQAGGEY